MGFNGELVFNTNYPWNIRKLMDVSRINNMGWKSTITLEKGIERLLLDLESELEKYI